MSNPLIQVDHMRHLLCPKCGSSWNHIETASISLNRQSVSAHGDRLVIPADSNDGTAAPQSTRGSRVEVIFICEGCHSRYAMGFAFHKGNVMAEVAVLGEVDVDAEVHPYSDCLWRD
ncbi:MAG: hypothetical protein IV100_17750 [Myxococcales bacterium]|nr:hypothetical protein [Myxococcales bacterium]